MKYSQVVKGQFEKRMNRFIAEVLIEGVKEQVHIKNTGRLKELLRRNNNVILEVSDNPNRKTKYSLIAAEKNGRWVNIDSLAPNKLAYEALKVSQIREFHRIHKLKREVTYGGSRLDIYFETDEEKGFIEVKGVTYEHKGIAMFPDAPTLRGTKHVRELIKARQEGYTAAILFVVQMSGCHLFTPYKAMDMAFANTLIEAHQHGVHILAYDTLVKEDELTLNEPIPVRLFE